MTVTTLNGEWLEIDADLLFLFIYKTSSVDYFIPSCLKHVCVSLIQYIFHL